MPDQPSTSVSRQPEDMSNRTNVLSPTNDFIDENYPDMYDLTEIDRTGMGHVSDQPTTSNSTPEYMFSQWKMTAAAGWKENITP